MSEIKSWLFSEEYGITTLICCNHDEIRMMDDDV
jgi:hypothetical protein